MSEETRAVINITYTYEDVDEYARMHDIPIETARDRALSWSKHIEQTMSGYCAEQLESVVVHDQP